MQTMQMQNYDYESREAENADRVQMIAYPVSVTENDMHEMRERFALHVLNGSPLMDIIRN